MFELSYQAPVSVLSISLLRTCHNKREWRLEVFPRLNYNGKQLNNIKPELYIYIGPPSRRISFLIIILISLCSRGNRNPDPFTPVQYEHFSFLT